MRITLESGEQDPSQQAFRVSAYFDASAAKWVFDDAVKIITKALPCAPVSHEISSCVLMVLTDVEASIIAKFRRGEEISIQAAQPSAK